MQHVYRFRNNLTKTYSPIWEFRPDPFKAYARLLHDQVILFPEKLTQNLLHITTVEHVGVYDQETGIITFDNPDQSAGDSYNIQEAYEQLQALKAQSGGKNV